MRSIIPEGTPLLVPNPESEQRLRVLVVHNAYQWSGGEEAVRNSEVALLQQGGHHVETYDRDNADIPSMSALRVARETLWSLRTTADIRSRINTFKPDIIHVHNSFPLVSPSLYWEAARARVPVVQTLHNYRLLCPQAMFLREERVCEDCLGKLPWRGVLRSCYRNSASQSAVVVAMLGAHNLAGTFRNKVSRYIALNEFCREKFVAGGLPREKISVKPNFVTVPELAERPRKGGIFVGRLSAEKGVKVMLDALDVLQDQVIEVAGTGPMRPEVESHGKVRYLGALPRDEVLSRMKGAAYLVMPSVWHEVMPLTVIEAFASGLPVIGSRSGALATLIEDGKTGLLCEPGNPQDLARKILEAEINPGRMREMGRNAAAEYQRAYTPARNYELLTDIYKSVISTR